MRVDEAQRGLNFQGMQLGLRTLPWAYFSIRAMLDAAVAAKSDRIARRESMRAEVDEATQSFHARLTQKVSADLFQ